VRWQGWEEVNYPFKGALRYGKGGEKFEYEENWKDNKKGDMAMAGLGKETSANMSSGHPGIKMEKNEKTSGRGFRGFKKSDK